MHTVLLGGAVLLRRPRRAHIHIREACGTLGELCCMRQALKKLYFGDWLAMRMIRSRTSPCRAGAPARRTTIFTGLGTTGKQNL